MAQGSGHQELTENRRKELFFALLDAQDRD
jgi:hypothetical protein